MIVLERTYEADQTLGVIHAYHGRAIPVFELPWKGNQPRVSCIPEGRYTLHRDTTGRHQYFRIDDSEVGPQRSAIEIHQATRLSHLLGCIGVPSKKDLFYLLGSMPAGDTLWIRSETGPPQ